MHKSENMSQVSLNKIPLLVIVLSNHCNLDCSYCCIRSKGESNVLSMQDVETYLELNGYTINDFKIVEFFGGEPSLHLNTIVEIIQKYPDQKYRFYTNGTKDLSLLYSFKDSFYEILVSTDGIKKNHLRAGKVFANSSVFTQQVEKTISLLLDNDMPVSAAITITDDEMTKDLSSIVDSLKALGVRSFSIELATLLMDKTLNKRFTSIGVRNIMEYFYLSVLPTFLKQDEDSFLFNMSPELYDGQLNGIACTDGVIALSPSGNIYNCRDTAANEQSLIKREVLHFYKDRSLLRSFNTSNTCHVKCIQGFNREEFLSDFSIREKDLLKIVYLLIKSMNKFYESKDLQSLLFDLTQVNSLFGIDKL